MLCLTHTSLTPGNSPWIDRSIVTAWRTLMPLPAYNGRVDDLSKKGSFINGFGLAVSQNPAMSRLVFCWSLEFSLVWSTSVFGDTNFPPWIIHFGQRHKTFYPLLRTKSPWKLFWKVSFWGWISNWKWGCHQENTRWQLNVWMGQDKGLDYAN